MTLISVVITTYYRNERLRTALESVVQQTHSPIETVVVDGSNDRNAEPIVEEYDDVKYYHQNSDEGPHAGRSEGFTQTEGDYVQFLDDDDELKPSKLAKQVALLEQDGDVGVVYCGRQKRDGNVDLPTAAFCDDAFSHTLAFTPEGALTTSTMLTDSTVLESIHPFSNTHGADDMGWRIELAQRTEFDFIEESLVISGEPEESRGISWDSVAGRKEILARYEELYEQAPDWVRSSAIAETARHTARRYLEDRYWDSRAIWQYTRSLYYDPNPSIHDIGECLASFGGRPGKQFASRLV